MLSLSSSETKDVLMKSVQPLLCICICRINSGELSLQVFIRKIYRVENIKRKEEKIMKKFLTILMSLILVLGTFAIQISAAEMPEVSRLSAVEIFNRGEIIKINEDSIIIEYDRVMNRNTSPFSLNNDETRQKDSCMIVLDETMAAEDMIELLASTTSSETDSYEGAAAILYSTINYKVTSKTGYDYIQLVSASGRVVKLDSRTTVTQNQVRLGTVGFGVNGDAVSVSQMYYYPNAYSWSVTAPSKFVPVAITAMNEATFVGCNYTCTLKRGTANIEYKLTNNAYEP